MSNEDGDPPRDAVPLSRLPNPYLRRKSSLISPLTPIVTNDLYSSRQDGSPSRNGALGEQLRKSLASPSESGTEADDEGYGLVIRALPAPPFKPRKGLRRRTTKDDEEGTPPLTPTKLDNEVLRLSDVGIHEPGPRDPMPDTQSSLPGRSKATRRRRAEILRRVIEGALLALSGALVLVNQRVIWIMSFSDQSTFR
jgi:hypothetical protein